MLIQTASRDASTMHICIIAHHEGGIGKERIRLLRQVVKLEIAMRPHILDFRDIAKGLKSKCLLQE